MTNYNVDLSRLKECREKLGITKMEAASRMGMSQPAYLRYENGSRKPSIHTLNTIAAVLNTSVDYLTGVSDSPTPDCYVVRKGDDPELFSILETYTTGNVKVRKRILSYVEKLSK